MDVAEVVDVAKCLSWANVLTKIHSELELTLVPLLGKPQLDPTSRGEREEDYAILYKCCTTQPVNCTIPSCVSSSPYGVDRSHFECELTGSSPALAAQTGGTGNILE